MAAVGESDEAFARRLQAIEMGMHVAGTNPINHGGDLVPSPPQSSSGSGAVTSNTPLIADGAGGGTAADATGGVRGPGRAPSPAAINNRLAEVTSTGAQMWLMLCINGPQIIAGMCVLPLHWGDSSVCDSIHRNEWLMWSTVAVGRLSIHTLLVTAVHLFKPWLSERPWIMTRLTRYRSLIDAFGLGWFVIGNMWLLGDDAACPHPGDSPVYMLCLSMLIISYVQICLPCIIAVAMIPVFCFCMPCLIRLLARLNHLQTPTKGATDALIDSIPLVTLDEAAVAGEEDCTCPVCLSEMVVGDEARKLPCNHLFHQGCVDEWLRVNATCPTCRNPVVTPDSSSDTGSGGSGERSAVSQAPSSTPEGSPDSSAAVPLMSLTPSHPTSVPPRAREPAPTTRAGRGVAHGGPRYALLSDDDVSDVCSSDNNV